MFFLLTIPSGEVSVSEVSVSEVSVSEVFSCINNVAVIDFICVVLDIISDIRIQRVRALYKKWLVVIKQDHS